MLHTPPLLALAAIAVFVGACAADDDRNECDADADCGVDQLCEEACLPHQCFNVCNDALFASFGGACTVGDDEPTTTPSRITGALPCEEGLTCSNPFGAIFGGQCLLLVGAGDRCGPDIAGCAGELWCAATRGGLAGICTSPDALRDTGESCQNDGQCVSGSCDPAEAFGLFRCTTRPTCGLLGSVTIAGPADIAALAGVCEVSGDVVVRAPGLSSLAGLESLTAIGGTLELTDNSALTDLDGLAGLRSVGGFVLVERNLTLLNVDGLAGLTSVAVLAIRGNPALDDLRGLSNLVATDFLYIERNAALTHVSGLGQLAVRIVLIVVDNPSLVNVDGLGVSGDVGSIEISGNRSLASLTGLRSVRATHNGLVIRDNDALQTLAGLEGLQAADSSLIIDDNAALLHLDALTGLTSVGAFGGSLEVANNPALASITGLSALATAPLITMTDNPSLPQCQIDALAAQTGGAVTSRNNNNANCD